MAITIDKNRCPQNHRCKLPAVCPTGAIAQKENELPTIDAVKCIECGECTKHCGKKATYKL